MRRFRLPSPPISLAVVVLCFLFALHHLLYTSSPKVMAFSENQSWYDQGLKVIVFDDHSGYVFRYSTPLADGWPQQVKMVAFHLTPSEYAALVQSYRASFFLLQPQTLSSRATDGTEHVWFFAAGGVYHKARNYQVPNPFTIYLTSAITALIEPKYLNGQPIALAVFLADVRHRLQDPSAPETVHRALKDSVNHLLHRLSGSQLFDASDVPDLFERETDW